VTVNQANEPRRKDRVLAVVVTVALLIGALVLEFIAFLIAGFGCDESCSGDGGWRTDGDAWQWGFQLGWATVGLFLVGAALPLAAGGEYRKLLGVLAVAATTFIGWWMFVIGG
jgi:hypothetical protein